MSHGLVICRWGMTASGLASSLSLMQWHCLETTPPNPSPGYQGSPEVAQLILAPSCVLRVSCDSASVCSLSLPPRLAASQAWIHTLSPSGGHLGGSPRSSSQAGAPGPSFHTCWLLTARLCSSPETYPEPVGVPPSQDAQKIINYLPPARAGPQPVMDGFGVQKPSPLPGGASAVRLSQECWAAFRRATYTCQSSSLEFLGQKEQAVFPPKTPHFFPPGRQVGESKL